ncbi:MAG: hypothetical protein ABI222_12960 [Opitutaceae bacterium]
MASLALAVVWSMMSGARFLVATVEKWHSEKTVCRFLSSFAAAAFVAVALVPSIRRPSGFLVFVLFGLGCTALPPLIISFGQRARSAIAATPSAGLNACYLIGCELAELGVGRLQSAAALGWKVIFGGSAALAMAVVAVFVTRKTPADAAIT